MKALLLLVVVISSVISSAAKAHNSFTEGDAYLIFKYDYSASVAVRKGSELVFKWGGGSLKIKGETKFLRNQMLNAYRRYRAIHNAVVEIKVDSVTDAGIVTGKLVEERNPLYCFVYNKNYPLTNRLIGFKYNEGWILTDKISVGNRFLLADWMYADNYKYAKQVDGLKAVIKVKEVLVNAADVCIVLISKDHLMRYIHRENMEGVTVTRIAKNKVTVYELESNYGKYFLKETPSIEKSSEFGKAIGGGF